MTLQSFPNAGTPAIARPPRRRRRWIIVLGCLLAPLAILAGAYGYLSWDSDRALEAAIAEVERTDPRWRLDEIQADRPAIADAQNPAVVVGKVDALCTPRQYDIGEANWPLFDYLQSERQLNALQIEALRAALTKYAGALKMARTLHDMPGEGRFVIRHNPNFFSTNIEVLQRCRIVMTLLHHDAMLRANDGDADEALQSCRAVFVTARAIGCEPFLIAALIRFAGDQVGVDAVERVLAQGTPAAAELVATQALIASEIDAPVLLQAMRGERAGMDTFIAALGTGKATFSGIGLGGSESSLFDRFPVILTHGRPEYLQLMTRMVEATKLPLEKQRPVLDQVDQDVRASRAIVVKLLIPGVTKVAAANQRTQANLRCAMAGIAAKRYRLKHDRWPAALADLVQEGLLDAVPVDPIDGQPLRYKMLADGIVVYSIGPDGIDNGGAVNRERPNGPGTDLGMRLWNPDARRQPPLPPMLPQGGLPP